MAAVDLIIFGASGDLSARKLFPALLQLERLNLLDSDLRIAAVARTEQSLDDFLPLLKQKMSSYMGSDAPSDKEWERFTSRFSYVTVNFSEPDQYGELREWLDDERTSLFYFATPPSLFAPICEHLSTTNCLAGDCRIVVEKPIGENLESSVKVNETLAKYFDEKSIYRIDHYLGKETVQNLLVLRFANSFINSQWDNTCIDHVQITVGEMVGIEGRWTYYDKVGQLRDMVQNHLMQLMCLVAMEPPNSLKAESIRDEKVKIVRALRRIDSQSVNEKVVRGQYINGWIRGTAVPGYLDEDRV
jgi:glucose-6-phosphate 1-dehydrogenase